MSLVNIAMVYPEYRTPTFWSFREALKIVNKRANMPPYGLISIAGMLPENFHVKLYDENIRPIRDHELVQADLVMASAMIVQKDSLLDLIARCNKFGKPIIVGGPLINTGFDDIPNADHYFIGEAEQGLSQFIADFQAGKAKKAYGHVVDESKASRIRAHFKNDCTLIVGERPALTAMSLPRFDLLDHAQYGSMAVQFSRGCPVGCEFCDIWTQYGRKPRTKDVARLLAELDAIRSLGYCGPVFIVDDNFIGNKKVVKTELLPALIEWQREAGYPFCFFTEATITLGNDDELLSLMNNAGFDMVFVGIETPHEQSLLESNKGLNTDRKNHQTAAMLLAQIEKIQRAGMEVSTGLIVGFDSEPANIDGIMGEFIQQANIPVAMAGLLTALPETDLEKRLQQEGRLRSLSSGNNTHGFELNFESKRREADIIATYKRLLNQLYDRKLERYFARCEGLLDRMAANSRGARRTNNGGIFDLFRSFRHMLPTSYGWNYLRFLTRQMIKNPRTFPEAVTLGIKGAHLAHITRWAIEAHELSTYCDQVLGQLDEYGRSVKKSYRHGRTLLDQICRRKAAALRDVRHRVRNFKLEPRDAATARYDSFVREVHSRFEPIERMMQQDD